MATYQGHNLPLADSDVESEEEYAAPDEEEEETEEEKKMETLVTAVKNGFIKTVRELLDEDDNDYYIQGRDKEGHSLLHWAALGGYNNICELLLEKGSPINEHSDNDYGPRPVHWACVHGHVVTVDLFLERGVHIDTSDLNGCSPLLIAAQYGQSLVLSYLLQKGANKLHVDINGDTALHWGAFKGYPEIVFLLLNAGLDPKQKDSYGQTPMHSACIKGDIQVAEMLMEHGATIDDEDSNGKTPRMLAMKRRHHRLGQLLDGRDIPTQLWDWKTWVFGPPSRQRLSVTFFVCAILFWGYPMYYYKVLPLTLETMPTFHHVFWVTNVIHWILFLWLKFSNPGFIKPDREAFDRAQKMVGDPSSWGEYNDLHNPVYNMCHTCKTVRPIRSKHCRQCDRCVDHFDHHCPWIDNCVGIRNRVPFFFFVHNMLLNGCLTYLMVFQVLRAGHGGFLVYIGFTALIFFSFPVMIMLGYVWMLLILNMTTNERANYKRYRHFRDVHGQYHNPFSRGVFKNVLEYFNLLEPKHLKKSAARSFIA